MPSVTRRRSDGRARRAAVEHQVLEAVERLLADGESFTALGVQRIAQEAGMARSTFYGHFPDKSTLLMRLTETVTADLFALGRAWVDDDDRTREQHVAVLLAMVREYRDHAPLYRALAEVAAYEPAVAAFWREAIDGFAAVIRTRLERDVRSGLASADVVPGPAAAWIAWGTERAIAMHVETQPPEADEEFARGVAAATWGAMGRS